MAFSEEVEPVIYFYSAVFFKVLEIYQSIKSILINFTGINKIFWKFNMLYSKKFWNQKLFQFYKKSFGKFGKFRINFIAAPT